MSTRNKRCGFVLMLLVAFVSYECFAGTIYRFTVNCQDGNKVVEWAVGDVDPGKEYLRATTGTKYPGCNVVEYNPASDSNFPVDRISHERGFIEGIPLIGPIFCGIFGC